MALAPVVPPRAAPQEQLSAVVCHAERQRSLFLFLVCNKMVPALLQGNGNKAKK